MTQHPGQWRLEELQLVNWGTFHGLHRIHVPRGGFLLTGRSGSGKSSVVDAITAVLTPTGKASFNAAAADGSSRGSDRSKLTYVRGAYARGADEDTGEVTTRYLRTGATWSGILLRYRNGLGRTCSLVKLFHARRTAARPADLSELHVLVHEEVQLGDFDQFMTRGISERALKQAMPKAFVHKQHSRFAARFTRELGIGGERAVLLLHKTQSAKNLGSLDDLFRGFMLDEPETFALADRAVEQFAELSEAHHAVVTARRQIEHLTPLEQQSRRYDDAESELAQIEQLSLSRELFTRRRKVQLLEEARHTAVAGAAAAAEEHARADLALESAEERRRSAQGALDARGGAQLEALAAKIVSRQERLRDTQLRQERVRTRLEAAGLQCPQSHAELTAMQDLAGRSLAEDDATQDTAAQRVSELHEERSRAVFRKQELQDELHAMRGRRSNIDRRLLRARETVLRITDLPESTLPYAAELMQVRQEHSEWTGALERVLRPLATVMLVPAAHEDAVRAAVDAAHLGTRLRYQVVPAAVEPPRPAAAPSSLLHRVEVAEGRFAPWLHAELSSRFDYACVDAPEDLAGVTRGVSRSGQVKRGARSYEKDDRRAVDDRSSWILGFDNEQKVEHYLGLLREVEQQVSRAEDALGAAERERSRAQRRREALEEVRGLQWAELDVAARRRELRQAEQEQATLLTEDGDLKAAQHRLDRAEREIRDARAASQSALKAHMQAQAQLEGIDEELARLSTEPQPEISPEIADQLAQEFARVRSERRVTHLSIDAESAKVADALSRRGRDSAEALRQAASQIEKIAYSFRVEWPAEASEATADVGGRGEYLRILERLRADRLPDFEQRFFDMLREQSQQNVGLLAERIRSAPREVKNRVAPINDSLRRSPFSPGRHLEIRVDPSRPAVAQDFLNDLQSITADVLAFEDDREEAERRFQVLHRVMTQLGSSEAADRSWRTQCLDTRRHVKFLGLERDVDGVVVDWHESGQGRSGGQKQKLVVFCLAAALRYQLARESEEVPTYGSIVMDEAFDKSDVTFTRMALDIFAEFGFHMILATPLKMLQVLEDYVGGVALVTCQEGQDSHATPVTWEEARRHDGGIDPQDAGRAPATPDTSTETLFDVTT
ncbi:ATP-binding protein [Nesterenkonia sp. K-15-9-6]|uniref:ATP-binding protein n=1 Tax=Nesterenkonia sp. K-15-9-6 TaxID=3093918 RepID=UPI0040441917